MSKGNIHKKMTFEDKFDRNFACWVKNNRKAWHYWKRKTRKDFRHDMKEELDEDIYDADLLMMDMEDYR